MYPYEAPQQRLGEPIVGKKEILAVVLGAGIEFFDFSAYATFAVMIGRAFFPAQNAFTSLLLSVSVFGVGFIARPFGAVVLGAYADRAGRKPAMLLSMVGMTLGTAGLVLLPDYASIGMAAPILLVIFRLVQGLAWGGEAGPATTFLMEAAAGPKRGLYTSWQIVSQGAAGLCAGAIGYWLSLLLTSEQLYDWGWRVPFAVGLSILPVALYLRSHLQERFEAAPPSGTSLLNEVFSRYLGVILVGMLMISGSTITQYFLNYLATYALHDLGYPASVAMASPILIGLGVMVFSLLGGLMADRFGRKVTIILPRLVLIALLLPGLGLINDWKAPWLYFSVVSLFTALQCLSGAGLVVALCESFPRHIRSSGFSIAYTFGITLFGGTAQILFSWLVEATGNPVSPGYYLIAGNVVCILATLFLKEQYNRPAAAQASQWMHR